MNAMRASAVGLLALAAVLATAGAYLLATVGEEFDPRGRFGIYALLSSALIGVLASLVWRRST
jgi:hypothetical protein